jgi:transcriptional regulator with XRE-family HTH domain
MSFKVDLGKRCRRLRLLRRFSQVDVIRRYDFSLSHYQKIERGKLDPRLSTLKKLAEAYGVTLAQLVEDL